MSKKSKEFLSRIEKGLIQLKNNLIQKFTNNNSTIQSNLTQIRAVIYEFTGNPKPTTKEKVQINKYIRENIQFFISTHIQGKLTPIDKITKDPHSFVTTLNQIWSQFQIFIFSYYHACQYLTEFFTSFYKMNNAKDYQYNTRFTINNQVVSIPVMGVNELKKYFQKIKLVQKFKGVFNLFLQYDRNGKTVPRSEIRESIHCFESCYFDMDAGIKYDKERMQPVIIKTIQIKQKLSSNRRSKDALFFSDLIIDPINSFNIFYTDFVNQEALTMGTTGDFKRMLQVIHQQETRAFYYIHSEECRAVYLKNLNQIMIELNIENRIRKDGFKKYIELYQANKEQYVKEIKDLWSFYSRVLEKSNKLVAKIFSQYLFQQAQKICQKTKKPLEFIQELIRVNSKCIKIVEFCNNDFELQNERNNKIRGMLSNDLTQKGRKEGKYDIGAKNLAYYLNNKFKNSYTKGGLQYMGSVYRQLVGLFKILQQKDRFINEQQKFMATRLQEQVEFSKDYETEQIITMEEAFIEQIQKERGVSDVKELAENIKDIKKSIDLNNKIRLIMQDQRYPLAQIIIKNGKYWPERTTYNIENPPRALLKSYNTLNQYFKGENQNIRFEFNSGVSIFQGEFDGGKKQRFKLKNIYLLILLFVDQEKKILYGILKRKIEAVGVNKQRGIIELGKAVIELLYSGLLISSTKSMIQGSPNICKLSETDQLQVNFKYDFLEEEKKKKGSKASLKSVPILLGNILTLSEQLKREFDEEMKCFNSDQKKIEAERKFKLECITIKALKHAHVHHLNCTFQQLFKATQEGRNKEFRATEKFLKEIIDELINKEYCQRIQGEKNVFRYIA